MKPPKHRATAKPPITVMSEERLQKLLSRAGIASRRKAEQIITEGRVTVNGQIVTELGSKADLDRDHIKVDGKLIYAPKALIYIALYKPRGVVTTASDPEGRETVLDLVKGLKERVYPVGRLDYASEGLILLTNDGEFANRIMSPSGHVQKTYHAKVNGVLTEAQEEQFRTGISLHGRRTAPASIQILRPGENPWYEVTIAEGRQHQIRVMFKHLGLLVEKLKRVKIGFLELAPLKPGEFRFLSDKEIARFRKILGLGAGSSVERVKHPRSQPPPKIAGGR